MKSPIKLISLIIILTLVLVMNTQAHEGHGLEGQVDVVYRVTESNNDTNKWYDYSTGESFFYHVEEGSSVSVTIKDISDPQSNLDMQIGNLTLTDVPDLNSEGELSYGYYLVPATFGFVANKSWTDSQYYMEQIEFESFNFSLPHLEYLGGEVHTTLFEFKDSIQQTKLVYDQESGLLLEASSIVLGFELAIKIYSINGEPNYHQVDDTSDSSETSFNTNNLFMGLLSIGLFIIINRRR